MGIWKTHRDIGESLEIDFSSEQRRAAGGLIELILAVRGRDSSGLKSFLSREYIARKAEKRTQKRHHTDYAG